MGCLSLVWFGVFVDDIDQTLVLVYVINGDGDQVKGGERSEAVGPFDQSDVVGVGEDFAEAEGFELLNLFKAV